MGGYLSNSKKGLKNAGLNGDSNPAMALKIFNIVRFIHVHEIFISIKVKQWLLTSSEHKYTCHLWKLLGKDLGLDQPQVRCVLFQKKEI